MCIRDRAMPLDKFIAEVMEILKSQPASGEICVETVKRLRLAPVSYTHLDVYKRQSETRRMA